MGQQNKRTLILKWWLEKPAAHRYLVFREVSSSVCSFFLSFFCDKKRIVFKCSLDFLQFYALVNEFFRSACVWFGIPYPAKYPDTHAAFDQFLVVSFAIKKLFVYLFMVKESIYLVIQTYFMQICF